MLNILIWIELIQLLIYIIIMIYRSRLYMNDEPSERYYTIKPNKYDNNIFIVSMIPLAGLFMSLIHFSSLREDIYKNFCYYKPVIKIKKHETKQ